MLIVDELNYLGIIFENTRGWNKRRAIIKVKCKQAFMYIYISTDVLLEILMQTSESSDYIRKKCFVNKGLCTVQNNGDEMKHGRKQTKF
jgi:hypothetical protein